MKILFKSDEIEQIKRTVASSNFKKHYTNVNDSHSFDTLVPYIENATRDYVIRYLGAEFYAVVVAWYEDTNESDAIRLEIIELAQRAIANYTIYTAIPHLNAIIGDGGVNESAVADARPISQWRYKELRWNSLIQADKTMDLLTNLMEQKVDTTDLSTWKTSSEYTRYTTQFFHHTMQLTDEINVRGRRAFIAMIPSLRKAEREVEDLLCQEYANVTLADNPQKEALIVIIRRYVAHLGLKIGVPHLNMIYDGEGFTLASSKDGFDSRNNASVNFTSQNSAPITLLLDQLDKDIARERDAIWKYISNNITAFPLLAEDEREDEVVYASDDCVGGILIDI